ncbi:MAG: tRNA epoxyqueuosine(34) reductase QueG [Thermoguttaceae bacterium]
MSPRALTAALKAEAARLGFDLAGATPAVAPPQIGRLRQWLSDGFAGEMRSMAARTGAYEHPRHVLPGVRSLLMLAVSYWAAEPVAAGPGQGTVARYAWGEDYHDLIRRRLQELADFHRRLTPGAAVRGVVDTAPLLERQFAQLAGLGGFGKNTTLLNERLGSWFVLAALLTSETLAYDRPQETDPCGACRKCLDACPTGALVEPYRLDARRCISYLTIEHRGPVPAELRGAIGERVFGCDACQEVCPWNSKVPLSLRERAGVRAAGDQPTQTVDLAELFFLDEAGFRQRFRGTSLLRAGRRGLLRNAAIVLGNRPHPAAVPALTHGLSDADPVIREACAWALGRFPPER